MPDSRRKGIRYEKDTAVWYREHGFPDAKRGLQSRSGGDVPDVIVPGFGYWVECKRYASLGLVGRAWDQAKAVSVEADILMGQVAFTRIPPVIHVRADRGDDLVVISREVWGRLIGDRS